MGSYHCLPTPQYFKDFPSWEEDCCARSEEEEVDEEAEEEEEEVEAPACRDDDAAIIERMAVAMPITGCADPFMDGACVDPEVGPTMKGLCPVTCGVCEAEEEAEEEAEAMEEVKEEPAQA